MRSVTRLLLTAGLLISAAPPVAAQGPAPPPRKIPGITTADPFPQACVSCHVLRAEENLDVRLSTIVKRLGDTVPPALLARAQAAAPAGVTLKGRHPETKPEVFQNIPRGCLECHGRAAREAPPFARLLHAIHLQGGEANHFLTMFQGECTLCHKLDAGTGAWSIPSGPEKQQP